MVNLKDLLRKESEQANGEEPDEGTVFRITYTVWTEYRVTVERFWQDGKSHTFEYCSSHGHSPITLYDEENNIIARIEGDFISEVIEERTEETLEECDRLAEGVEAAWESIKELEEIESVVNESISVEIDE